MSIGNVLYDAMAKSSITQKELAERVGLTQSYISQICHGKRVPTIGTLAQIGECLGISVTRFLEEEDVQYVPVSPPVGSGRMHLSEDEKQLVWLYRSMDKRNREVLKGIVSNM